MTLILVSLIVTMVVWMVSTPDRRTRNLVGLSLIEYLILFAVGCSDSEVQALISIETAIAGIVPVVGATVSAVDPALAAPINAGVALITGGLQALQNLVKGYKKSPTATGLQEVVAAFTDIQQNLPQLEAAAKVVDPATQAKIAAIVNGAQISLAAVESTLAASHPANAPAAPPAAPTI